MIKYITEGRRTDLQIFRLVVVIKITIHSSGNLPFWYQTLKFFRECHLTFRFSEQLEISKSLNKTNETYNKTGVEKGNNYITKAAK